MKMFTRKNTVTELRYIEVLIGTSGITMKNESILPWTKGLLLKYSEERQSQTEEEHLHRSVTPSALRAAPTGTGYTP